MAADAQKYCPICSEPAALTPIAGQDAEFVTCRRCGKFVVAGNLGRLVLRIKDSEPEIKNLLPYLSAHTRQSSERGEKSSLIQKIGGPSRRHAWGRRSCNRQLKLWNSFLAFRSLVVNAGL